MNAASDTHPKKMWKSCSRLKTLLAC